jgi:UDP-GlcNAc:undecaprenyl-phosphate GlcNAc-1-phosphate transferase
MQFTNFLLDVAPERFLDGFRAPLVTCFLAAFVTWILTPLVKKFAISKGAVDDPKSDDRRVHKKPIPRWGGMALYAGIVVAIVSILPFAYPKDPFAPYVISLLIFGGLIVIVGALDDLYQFSAKQQALFLLLVGFGVQFFSGSDPKMDLRIEGFGLPLFGNPGEMQTWKSFGLFAYPITAIYIFVVTKTMDTIDGLDGLASGIASIAAATLAIAGVFGGQPRVALIAAAVMGASLGFLKHNFNPAKIFLGTGGSQLLGFMLACLSIVGTFKTLQTFAILIPMLIFGVPFFDAIFVIIRRLLSGQSIMQADKRHLHHTLMRAGLNQRQTVSILYLITLSLCAIVYVIIVSLN